MAGPRSALQLGRVRGMNQVAAVKPKWHWTGPRSEPSVRTRDFPGRASLLKFWMPRVDTKKLIKGHGFEAPRIVSFTPDSLASFSTSYLSASPSTRESRFPFFSLGLCEAIILDRALSLIFAGMKSVVGMFMKKDHANERINR